MPKIHDPARARVYQNFEGKCSWFLRSEKKFLLLLAKESQGIYGIHGIYGTHGVYDIRGIQGLQGLGSGMEAISGPAPATALVLCESFYYQSQ